MQDIVLQKRVRQLLLAGYYIHRCYQSQCITADEQIFCSTPTQHELFGEALEVVPGMFRISFSTFDSWYIGKGSQCKIVYSLSCVVILEF